MVPALCITSHYQSLQAEQQGTDYIFFSVDSFKKQLAGHTRGSGCVLATISLLNGPPLSAAHQLDCSFSQLQQQQELPYKRLLWQALSHLLREFKWQ